MDTHQLSPLIDTKNRIMNKVKVLLVEDEPIIADDLENQLVNAGVEVTEIFDNGEETLEYLKNKTPDLIIMDIQLMGDLDGIETAHIINQSHQVPIIFLTSNTDKNTFNRAKFTYPHAFLSKPFRLKDIMHSISLALEIEDVNDNASITITDSGLRDRIFIRDKDSFHKVMYNDILFIEADGSYSQVYTAAKTYIISQSIKKIEQKLESDDLQRIHRSFIVNIQNIDRLSDGMVHIGSHNIPVSRANRENLRQLFNSI